MEVVCVDFCEIHACWKFVRETEAGLSRQLPNQVYLRPQGDVRLVVAHGDIAVNMLRHNSEIYLKILGVLVSLQVRNEEVKKQLSLSKTCSSEFCKLVDI